MSNQEDKAARAIRSMKRKGPPNKEKKKRKKDKAAAKKNQSKGESDEEIAEGLKIDNQFGKAPKFGKAKLGSKEDDLVIDNNTSMASLKKRKGKK